MTPALLTAALKEEAHRLGFDLAGATPAAAPPGIERFDRWLAEGHAGQMRYMADRAEAYRHPQHVLEGARSVLVLATNYRTVEPSGAGPGQAVASRYAWGTDYHEVIRRRLHRLADFHRQLMPEVAVRGVVDTAPLLEREFARLAGLGWIGKNTLLLSKRYGSWLFLAALLTSAELQYDKPLGAGHCGSCRACLDACPTGALVEPYRLDARRCISYLTIELRDPVPGGLREAIGDHLVGCDRCQEICPFNHRTPPAAERAFYPGDKMNPVTVTGLFLLDEAQFRRRFRHTPLWRLRRRGVLRNAAIVLGNRPHAAALPGLVAGLEDDEPLVRSACAWALGCYAIEDARKALVARQKVETVPAVQTEIEAALQRCP
ncbi:MAG: tRNA epoxyqueuosine(34) reductase QueG [Pirellulales bacterium]|nr:tRNA epoxyqueuosine(34) reductase QueG [Pirellulales bacterium]